MGPWRHLAGRFGGITFWSASTKFSKCSRVASAEGSSSSWSSAAKQLTVFERSKDQGHQRTYSHVLGVPGMLVLGLGANQILAEELSNKTSPPREGSILNEGPVLHLSDEGLIASQPGEAPSNSHTAKWRIYTDMGRDLFSKGRLDEAEKYFIHALEEAKKGFGENDPHVASSCNNLAELYRMKKDYARAEPLFLEAVKRLESAFSSENHESVGFALHNLAGTYLLQRKFDEARKCYERSLKIKERKLGQNHPEYANTLFHLGEVLRLQGNYKDAEELIRDSIRILEEGGVGHSQTTIRRMGRLVEILTLTGQMQEAENLQRKILHVLELSQGVEATNTTMAAENLAGTLQAVGKLKDAEELLQRCFQVRQKILPPNHIQLGVTMFKLASVIIQRGDMIVSDKGGSNISEAKLEYETAEELLQRAIRIAERCWKESSGARGPISLRAGPLISLLRSLDAFGRLKIRKLELATAPEEIMEGTKEAEKSFLQCLYILDKSDLPQELASIPEVRRQHIACLRHLAGLLSSSSYVNKNPTTKQQIDQLLSRSESVEAELRDSTKVLKN
ncbi:hypothetical protein MPTK1_2g18390 [Marchantia polymorpha subsp. ruderalis]|uniref:Uncharacterized protein n=1 Tax=Marchantia polymorpha TaxID=3197 RepID=A0A2R6W2C9_MARPO|nr:hypothetical protein MARPO_0177s0018 [Marchantia polymorpha]BBN02821.1 hypothetical protein Mp_2g18390 [Marchantia polymorpha subsp. ruderalis]|eukprot:PTQ28007.1 hypothetical protein MARPO_0177s0018 [Marchantia polymorpha]